MTRRLVFQVLILLAFPVTLELLNTYFFKVTYGIIPFGGFLENLTLYSLIAALTVVVFYTVILSVMLHSRSLWNNSLIILTGLSLHLVYLLIKHGFYLDYGLIGTVYVTSLVVCVLLSHILILITKNQQIDNKSDVLDGRH